MLTPDVAYKAVFTNLTIIDTKNDRSLKTHFVRAVLPKTDPRLMRKADPNGVFVVGGGGGGGEGVEKRSCEVCKSVSDISNVVKRRDTAETFNILK